MQTLHYFKWLGLWPCFVKLFCVNNFSKEKKPIKGLISFEKIFPKSLKAEMYKSKSSANFWFCTNSVLCNYITSGTTITNTPTTHVNTLVSIRQFQKRILSKSGLIFWNFEMPTGIKTYHTFIPIRTSNSQNWGCSKICNCVIDTSFPHNYVCTLQNLGLNFEVQNQNRLNYRLRS